MNDDQRLLLQESPPPSLPVNPGTPAGWNFVENEIGCQLPDDYKWLINTYGSGDFCDLLTVLNPFPPPGWMCLLSRSARSWSNIGMVDHSIAHTPASRRKAGYSPYAESSGGYLFWLTRGQPDEWQLAFFDYDDNEHYPVGLVQFLAQWISGRMPESFFGTGNSPDIIRRDPVFCPSGQVRAPRPSG